MAVIAVAWATTARAQGAGSAMKLPENDNGIFSMTRLELDGTRVGARGVGSWMGEGWIGTDMNRFWWSTEGEQVGSTAINAELRAMYGHYFARFWDAVVGYDREFNPVGVNYLNAGVRGLAPYWFDVEALLLVSDRARVSLRTDVGTDWLLTQRLITHPQLRVDWPLTADPRRGLTPGLGDATVGLATRYEFRREFAPYAEVRWSRDAGAVQSAERRGGTDVSGWTVRGGVRLLF